MFSSDIEEVSSSVKPSTRNTKANAMEDVTLEIGEQIFKKYREYFELSAIRQAEGIIEELCKSLAKTQYFFPAELGSVKRHRVSSILR